MQAAFSVPGWKRLLLAFLATLVTHLLNTIAFGVVMLVRSEEPRATFFRSGGEAQAAALFAILGGYFVLALFVLIGAPLALFVPVRLQLRHWYGMLLAAALLPFLLVTAVYAHDAPSFWRSVYYHDWFGGYIAFCGLVTWSLYLWLLRSAAGRRSLLARTASGDGTYKM